MTNEPNLRDYLAMGWPYRRTAALIIVIGVALSAIVAFVWPPTYQAVSTLLPPTEEQTGFSVSSLLRGLNLPGVQVPTRSGPEDIAVSVLESRRIKQALAIQFDLQDVYGTENMTETLEELSKNSSFQVDENGMLIIKVEDRSPERAADLANAYVDELDRFNREVRSNKGRRLRVFVESRLEETRKAMTAAEDSLRKYQQEHSSVMLSPEQASTVEVGARLFARQAALRVKLGMTRQFASESSEEVQTILRELEQVNREIALLPDIGLEMARQLRELKIQEQIYALLSAQYEEARIDETKDMATLDVLDVAVPPEKRVWPRRGVLIVIGFVLSLMTAAGWVALSVRRSGAAA